MLFFCVKNLEKKEIVLKKEELEDQVLAKSELEICDILPILRSHNWEVFALACPVIA